MMKAGSYFCMTFFFLIPDPNPAHDKCEDLQK